MVRLFPKGVACAHPCNCCGQRNKCNTHQTKLYEDQVRKGRKGCNMEGFDHTGKGQFLSGDYVPQHIEPQRPQKKNTSMMSERVAAFRAQNPRFLFRKPDTALVRDILVRKAERERYVEPASLGGFLLSQDCIAPNCGGIVGPKGMQEANQCTYLHDADSITDKVGQNPMVYGQMPCGKGFYDEDVCCDGGFERIRRSRAEDPRYFYVGETELREGVFAGRDLESVAAEYVPLERDIQFPDYADEEKNTPQTTYPTSSKSRRSMGSRRSQATKTSRANSTKSFGNESVHGVGVNASTLTTWCEQVRAGYHLDAVPEDDYAENGVNGGEYDEYAEDDEGGVEEAIPVEHTGYTDDEEEEDED